MFFFLLSVVRENSVPQVGLLSVWKGERELPTLRDEGGRPGGGERREGWGIWAENGAENGLTCSVPTCPPLVAAAVPQPKPPPLPS